MSCPAPPPSSSAAWPTRRAALLALLLAGCASSPKPTALDGSLTAAPDLNPSVNQRPSPLVLRLYELRSATSFNQADFMALYQSDTGTLAADLVAREEMLLQPGETRPIKRQLAPDTRFLGVVAAYRNLERATWRAVVAVQPGRAQTLTIRADSLAVSAAIKPR